MDYFGIDKNTSATIIITVLVFGAGVLTTLLVDFMKTWYRRRMLQEVLKLNLVDFAKSLEKQAVIYFDTATQFSFERQGPLESSRVEISQIQSIKEIGYDQSFQAFFYGIYNIVFFRRRRLKIKSFHKLWDAISSIAYWHDKSVKDFDFYLEQYNGYNEKRNRAIDSYRRFIELIFMNLNNQQLPARLGTYLQAIDTIHLAWQKKSNRTAPHIVQRHLVLPVRILNRKYQDVQLVSNINAYLLDASIHYENMSNLLSVKQKQYLYYGILFKGSCRLLKKIERIL